MLLCFANQITRRRAYINIIMVITLCIFQFYLARVLYMHWMCQHFNEAILYRYNIGNIQLFSETETCDVIHIVFVMHFIIQILCYKYFICSRITHVI